MNSVKAQQKASPEIRMELRASAGSFCVTAWPTQGCRMFLRALHRCLLHSDRLGGVSTPPGSLFQCLPTLLVQKCFLISSLNLAWHSSAPFSHWGCPSASSSPNKTTPKPQLPLTGPVCQPCHLCPPGHSPCLESQNGKAKTFKRLQSTRSIS